MTDTAQNSASSSAPTAFKLLANLGNSLARLAGSLMRGRGQDALMVFGQIFFGFLSWPGMFPAIVLCLAITAGVQVLAREESPDQRLQQVIDEASAALKVIDAAQDAFQAEDAMKTLFEAGFTAERIGREKTETCTTNAALYVTNWIDVLQGQLKTTAGHLPIDFNGRIQEFRNEVERRRHDCD